MDKTVLNQKEDDTAKYHHLTPREALLLRPDADLGSVIRSVVPTFVYDQSTKTMKREMLDISQGIVKIFLEILQNAIDSQYLEKSDLKSIKVNIENNEKITVFSDACGIPVAKAIIDGKEMYHLTALFSRFHSSSNLIDESKPPYTGGRNGKGAKITNVWSKYFHVKTLDAERQLLFEQTWTNNMSECSLPKITKSKLKRGYVEISFIPDWTRFEMPEKCTLDMSKAIESCVWGAIACTNPKVKISLNDHVLEATSFLQYAKMFQYHEKGIVAYDVVLEPLKNMALSATSKITSKGYDHENYLARLEICAMRMDDVHGRSSIGYVNALRCNTGLHMTYIYSKIAEHIKVKMEAKGIGEKYKLDLVRDNIFIVARVLLKNPSFDSQTKETLNGPKIKDFGFDWEPSESFLKSIDKLGIIDEILFKMDEKKLNVLNKVVKKPNIAKYECAEYAGKKNTKCTLIIVEGDSAKNLVMSGISVIGRTHYGVYPIRGKILNVRNKTLGSCVQGPGGVEVLNIMTILGVDFSKQQKCSELNYQNVLVMTDMDPDGAHIQGLLMNIFSKMIPHILKDNPMFVQRFATPEIRLTCKKTKIMTEFTSKGHYYKWMNEKKLNEKDIVLKYEVKYFKGLGSSSNADAKRYFKNIDQLKISLVHEGDKSETSIVDMFSSKRIARRKQWISQEYNPDEFMDYSQKTFTWNEYLTKEVIPYCYANCVRGIAHVFDGLKLSTRQILFTFFHKKVFRERKVSELGGAVIETTHYAHSEGSLTTTIAQMAQNYWCTNNINMLVPSGQFGSRASHRKQFSSARYIFTHLNIPVMHTLFPECDLPEKRMVEGEEHEPLVLFPILPLILINGSNGMGSGWSHTIHPHNPLDVLAITRLIVQCMEHGGDVKDIDPSETDILPWFVHFQGNVYRKNQNIVCEGVFAIEQETEQHVFIKITELPFQRWNDAYKENLEKKYLIGGENDMKKEKIEKQKELKKRKRKIAHCEDSDEDDEDSKPVLKKKKNEEEDEELDHDQEQDFEACAPPFIVSINDFGCIENKVCFILKCNRSIYEAQVKGREMQVLGLSISLSENNMYLWNMENKLFKYQSCFDIAVDFCKHRIQRYHERKQELLDQMDQKMQILDHRTRFIRQVAIEKSIVILNRSESELEKELESKHYAKIENGYGYLLDDIKTRAYTMESILKNEKELKKIKKEFEQLQNTSVFTLWNHDLDAFEKAYIQMDQERKKEYC